MCIFLLQNRREIWNTGISPSSGPRALLLKRSENGFGFTLRHFIVYPPESNAVITFVFIYMYVCVRSVPI